FFYYAGMLGSRFFTAKRPHMNSMAEFQHGLQCGGTKIKKYSVVFKISEVENCW
ncbi:Hypothetical protein FKW44_023652, partial [Caligus rogercresseyi]